MDKLSKLHAMITAGLCATSVYLMLELGSARERAQAEAKRASALQAELARVVVVRERLEKDVQALRIASATAYRDPATGTTPGANDNATRPPGGPSPGAVLPGWRAPEFSTEQRSLMARQRYGALFRELALSEAQIDALVPVLAAQDQSAWGRAPSGRIAESTPADPARNRAEIAAILGPQKSAQFETLKKSLPARSQLAIARMQLEQVGEPMNDAQRDKLFAIMSAREPLPPPLPVEGQSSEQNFEQFRSWQAERDRLFREDAASVLTPEQKKSLEENASLQASMRMLPGGIMGAAGSRAP
jgi:hypothetical protein